MKINTAITNTSVKNGSLGLELNEITVTIDFRDGENFFGGQVVLNSTEDNINLQTSTEEISNKAIEKAKNMISNATIYTDDEGNPINTEEN
ncbi:hypothetical protein [Leuconostoc mesenteroides]|uniref:hypothetical protein n=1 Tax=Leuconostoc mesenteroides TaxID=1245 RepID=UPI001E4B5364|nr:hypothetical protein [Leuconostoc mesenteroides]MCM6827625.1 hypothetical protein [Leuconostoc mesenteroides]